MFHPTITSVKTVVRIPGLGIWSGGELQQLSPGNETMVLVPPAKSQLLFFKPIYRKGNNEPAALLVFDHQNCTLIAAYSLFVEVVDPYYQSEYIMEQLRLAGFHLISSAEITYAPRPS